MGGSQSRNMNIPSPSNHPGARSGAVSWQYQQLLFQPQLEQLTNVVMEAAELFVWVEFGTYRLILTSIWPSFVNCRRTNFVKRVVHVIATEHKTGSLPSQRWNKGWEQSVSISWSRQSRCLEHFVLFSTPTVVEFCLSWLVVKVGWLIPLLLAPEFALESLCPPYLTDTQLDVQFYYAYWLSLDVEPYWEYLRDGKQSVPIAWY